VSGVEVVDENPPADEAAIRPISDSGIDLSSMETAGTDSGPQAGIEKNTPSTSDSGVDRIAEEVESGLNLGAESFEVIGDSSSGSGVNPVEEIVVDESGMALTAGQLPVGEEEVDLTETPAGGEVESSAVDLGGSATFPAAPPEPSSGEVNDLERTRPYESKGKSIHGEDDVSPSEVNLGSRHDGDSGRDFFEPSVAMSHAPEEAAEGEDAGLEGVDEESGVSVQEEAEEQEGASGVEEAEEALAPPAKEKRRSTAGAWSGGLVLGGVVTAGALLALWLFKIEPPAEWRSILGGGAPTTGAPTGPKAQWPAIAALTSAEKADLVKSGDLDRAAKAGIENADESKPEEVAARGQFRVRQYLMAQGGKAANPDDPDMKKGVDDLEKARDKNDAALFWLGVSKESAEKLDEAKKLYEEGAARFKDDPAKRQRFQDALNRISAEMGRKPAGVSEAAPMLDPALFVLIVTGLDAAPPAPQPPAAPAASEEAGSKFWEATKLAQDGKYDEALKALAAAIDRHKTRRFGALGKAQNPNSDPTEEIFLHSCQELEGYWKLRQNLQNTGLSVVKGADPAADVASLVNDYKNLSDERVQADKDILTLNTKLTKSNNDLTAANAKLADATKQVTDTQTKLTDANTDLTKTKDALAASEKKADGLAKDLTTTKQAVADKDAALKGVADALGAKPEGVVEAAKEAVKLKSVEESAKIIRDLRDKQDSLTAERDGLRTNLKERWQPEQMLSFWLPLLPERQDLADKAILDADRVLKDDKASPADKAHAHAVKGIALSDQEKYNDAKPELSKAKADLPKEDGEWVLATDAALTDASDPSASLARKADEYRKEGRNAQALALLDKAIKAAPQAPTALLIKRGGLHLQEALAHGKGQVVEGDADLTAARQDASKAMESKTAAAFYLGGRIAEAKGKRDAAADDYRQALTAHAALDADGARYRAALARMLTPASQDAAASLDPAMTEAQKLADEILADKDPKVPFEARAQALAVQGLWTEALTDFVDGLRPHLGQERAAVLQAIVQGHPALRRPTVMVVADPVAASKHYAAGLQWWNDRDFAKAEKEFFTAVEHDGQDARYYYYPASRSSCRATGTPLRTSPTARGWSIKIVRTGPP
jgi:hypothetical protein